MIYIVQLLHQMNYNWRLDWHRNGIALVRSIRLPAGKI
jgi:hypothetical protein